METYINDSLAAGTTRPSSSLTSAGFFWVEEGQDLQNWYPLPLMDTAFDLLHGATVFTKLDL